MSMPVKSGASTATATSLTRRRRTSCWPGLTRGHGRPRSVLFDLATARLIEAKVLLPGASVLGRAVASARDRAAVRLHRTLSDPTTAQQQRGLEQLLEVPAGGQLSRLEVLRAGPRKLTAS